MVKQSNLGNKFEEVENTIDQLNHLRNCYADHLQEVCVSNKTTKYTYSTQAFGQIKDMFTKPVI